MFIPSMMTLRPVMAAPIPMPMKPFSAWQHYEEVYVVISSCPNDCRIEVLHTSSSRSTTSHHKWGCPVNEGLHTSCANRM